MMGLVQFFHQAGHDEALAIVVLFAVSFFVEVIVVLAVSFVLVFVVSFVLISECDGHRGGNSCYG